MSGAFKSFVSPLNFDRRSYASQLSKVFKCIIPVMVLGYLYSEKLEVISLVAFGIVGILWVIAMFDSKKICPGWVRSSVSVGLFSFILFCLPAIIYECSDQEHIYIFFDNGRDALIFGFVCWLFVLISIIISNRKAHKKRVAEFGVK